MANQLLKNPDKEENIKNMYSDIRKEEEQTIKYYKIKIEKCGLSPWWKV